MGQWILWLALGALPARAFADHGGESWWWSVRTVPVCLLTDHANPVPDTAVRAALELVSREYVGKVGVAFKAIGPIVSYEGDLADWPISLGPGLHRACPEETEVRIVFSNARIFRDELSNPPDLAEGCARDEFAGHNHPYFGFIVMFNVEERLRGQDAGGHPPLYASLKHEIGHLFGLDHSSDPRSFMYTAPPCGASAPRRLGEWTQETVRELVKNRDIRWFPRR